MSSEYRLSLPPKTIENAEPRARTALESAQANMGFIPNMYAVMANSPGLLESYLHGYALFRAESGFTPVEQEVIFLTISRENGCHYCMAAHSFVADAMSKVPSAVTDAIRDGKSIPDATLAALSAFAITLVKTRGQPSRRDVESFLAAGYSERSILEIILAIAVKTLSNYSNHLFHTSVDPVFASREWKKSA
ncbi:carboxymuconolactone decarboxylase family protein [Methylocaldum sp.]|uniref:carboxymuconolactone decarboxylase family protein n=1 Tax=Methylocaldum sp. TaxID=1969727 RepID=UPI002D6D0704|nr:carboxymuconolactone decarboxylase family protein [Methylocaldum sp.]HYE38116.1 carboxymuconolactone decarboxylase family protein [Methylocaldum sp.]